MSRNRLISTLALVAGLTLAACSEAGSPTEAPADGPAFAVAGNADAKARHAALQDQLAEVREAFLARKAEYRDSLKAAKDDWNEWRRDYNAQRKAAQEAWKREHKGDKTPPPAYDVELLRCEPKPYDAEVAIIGPNGGQLHAGAHTLVIPKGALDHEELISMEAPTSSLVDVRFEPHGLQFQQPAQLKLSYVGCVRPTTADLMVAYIAQGGSVLELPPSVDLKGDKEVDADIDHFSRYAIAY
jgi:hypothetical protein